MRSVLALISLIALVACGRPFPRGDSRDAPCKPPRLLIGGDASQSSSDADAKSTLIRGVPHVHQKPDFCGEACVEMALRKLGFRASQDWVFEQAGVDPLEGRGAVTRELADALKKIGFDPGPVWHEVAAAKASTELGTLWRALLADLQRGIPSIVCMHYGDAPKTTEHFRLVLGYDHAKDEVIYHEPAKKHGAYRRMARSLFLKLWPLKYSADKWLAIRFRVKATRIRVGSLAPGFTKADFAQHMMKLRPKVPNGFTVVLEPPFVVVGDEDAETVRARAKGVVRWATERLKALYFEKDPHSIIDIWLFKDAASYRKHATALFGSEPTTPYGYYTATHRALVMNIATGGGTLVHEIVHPFMAANFPGAPAWLNEGLGSLYEQSSERDGQIIGLTNWRLAGLKRAIEGGQLPPFKRLLQTTDHQFYGDDSGKNYAEARYLLYYLQERGLLGRYYHAFRKNRASDPSGYATLKEILGTNAMAAFQKEWETFVLKLSFSD